jgi:hypothetical protein
MRLGVRQPYGLGPDPGADGARDLDVEAFPFNIPITVTDWTDTQFVFVAVHNSLTL